MIARFVLREKCPVDILLSAFARDDMRKVGRCVHIAATQHGAIRLISEREILGLRHVHTSYADFTPSLTRPESAMLRNGAGLSGYLPC